MEKMVVVENEENFYSPERGVEEDDDERNETARDNEEKRKIDLMRAIVEKHDPTCKQRDDLTLRRFLRARNLNVEKAAEMILKYVIWRRTFVPKGSISVSEITNELAQNKLFMQGKDKNGCPVGLVLASRHFLRKDGIEELKRVAVFLLDRLCSSDVRAYLAGFSILQDYYPERLGKLVMVNVPFIFMTMWKILYPFIDKNTRNKTVFVENKKLHDTLKECVDESQLPDIYGGKLKLVPVQEA